MLKCSLFWVDHGIKEIFADISVRLNWLFLLFTVPLDLNHWTLNFRKREYGLAHKIFFFISRLPSVNFIHEWPTTKYLKV